MELADKSYENKKPNLTGILDHHFDPLLLRQCNS
jgi:hypothetical protein